MMKNAKHALQGGQDLAISVTCCPDLFILVAQDSQVQQAAEAHLRNLLWTALRDLGHPVPTIAGAKHRTFFAMRKNMCTILLSNQIRFCTDVTCLLPGQPGIILGFS